MRAGLLCKNMLLSLLLVATPCWSLVASASELQPLLTQLKQAAARTQTLSSRFVQEKRLEIFDETLLSEGRFVYQQPDKLRWELLTPLASGFVLRGEQGERWNQLSGERKSFGIAEDPIMGMIARQLLAWAQVDLDWLQQRYRIELLAKQPLRLHLTPKDPGEAGIISHLQIRFDEQRRYVAEVLMVEQGGDSTLLRFNDVQLNNPLPPHSFQPPEL